MIEKRTAVKIAAAITSAYLAVVLIIFGAERSASWFFSNNRGYQMTVGFQDFSRVNQHLKTAYRKKGLNPLNAPRVVYEKCDLYGPYGGDRVFESLPFFSGRQTLEGIHFAGSLASRSMAYLQTEFSRDIKTPKPQILSRINIDALPAHFDLYNISQLIIMTRTVKKALWSSPWFEKEAVFGDISLYRYVGSDQRYVDVPKIRPVLYTGKNWADDFYTWFQDPNRVDVLLVPDRFVSDAKDRTVFSGRTDSFAALEAFRKNRLDREQLKIDTRLDHLKIRFTTNKIGRPHLVKVSYFPNWRVKGARGIYPVSPHLMMVIPREKEVVLTYARSSWEILGLVITAGWIVFTLGTAVYKYAFLTRKDQNRAGRNKIRVGLERGLEALERNLVRYRLLILCLVMVTALGLMAAGAALRNRPVRIYTAGFQTYKKGVQLLQEGQSPEAKKYLRRAIAIMEPLIDKRASSDHRDVINSLLITAMCHEKLADYRSAEKRYRTLINEYPRSRYVGEGYVKLARIYKWQAAPLWQQGLNAYRLGEKKKGAAILRQGLALMEKSLDHFLLVPEKDPYSNWARYALDDLKKEKRFLKNALKELMALRPDAGLRNRLEKLLERVKAR